jgi:hypothetical protein
MTRTYKPLAKPYEEFAQSIKSPQSLQECLNTYRAVFAEDKNLGLISQVLEHLEMKRISNLKDTYLAISLEDVTRKVCQFKDGSPLPDDILRIESLILRMVGYLRNGKLTCRLMKEV